MRTRGVFLLLLQLLLQQLLAQGLDAGDAVRSDVRTYVDWDRELVVYHVSGSCYVGPLLNTTSSSSGGVTPLLSHAKLYVTQQLEQQQVLELNGVISADCPGHETWWLSLQRPHLSTLHDYLSEYIANRTRFEARVGPGQRVSQGPVVGLSRHRRSPRNVRPSHSLRRRLQHLSRRTEAGNGRVNGRGSRVLVLTDDPYPSPLFDRSATDGRRFKHYKAFYDESSRNSGALGPSSRSESSTDVNGNNRNSISNRLNSNNDDNLNDNNSGGRRNHNDRRVNRIKTSRNYNGAPRLNVLNSYSLRVRGSPVTDSPQENNVKQNLEEQNSRSQQLQHQQHGRSYSVHYEDPAGSNSVSNNDKRHIVTLDNSETAYKSRPLEIEQRSLGTQYVEQDNQNQPLFIPDSIIKDGQIFYRHDANLDNKYNGGPDQNNLQDLNNFKEIRSDYTDTNEDEQRQDVNSLIYSQALGSTGNEGSFHAAAEGRGQNGEATHSAVEGGHNGASAAASAIRFDQHALAHVHVSPSSRGHSPSTGGADYTPEISPPVGISPTDIEEMMKRNGYTGFAMATVSARKKGGIRKPLSSLGHILPAYSSSHNEINARVDNANMEDKHDMVDSIVEQVYNPAAHGVIIDEGGLEGGSGDQHRESEFQQINQEELPEGGTGTANNNGSVGLATYSQGLHGYPPEHDLDYLELFYNADNYNFNQPLYFPDVDYENEIHHTAIGSQAGSPNSPHQLPTNLNTGIQYPIIEGGIILPSHSEDHMIVDNTLSSYFPQPQHSPDYEYNHSQVQRGNGTEDADPTENYPLHEPVVQSSISNSSLQPQYSYPYVYNNNINYPLGNEVINYNDHNQFNDKVPINAIYNVDYNNNFYQTPLQNLSSNADSREIWANVDSKFNAHDNLNTVKPPFPVALNNLIDDVPQFESEGILVQPAYNSLSEYERSQQRGSIDITTLPPTEPHRESGRANAYEPENMYVNVPASQNVDTPALYDGDINRSHAFVDDNVGLPDVDYNDRNYESSYETSSQSSSQSSQSVYTASHHYSYQHGPNERGIGSSTNAGLLPPSHTAHSPADHYDEPSPISNVQPSYTTSSAAHTPWQADPSPALSAREDFGPMQEQMLTNDAQGMENMIVLTPGRVGSMQNIPASDPNLPGVKVVMAEAPSPAELQQRMGKVILPGDKIPGTAGYMVPPGFRGRLVLGNIGVSSMSSSSSISPNMQMRNQVNRQIFPSAFNGNMQGPHLSLSSSSSARSSGAGVSLSSSSSSRASGTGSLSVTSSSSSNQMMGSNKYATHDQPIYSYRQTFNGNPSGNFHRRNSNRGSYSPNMNHPSSDFAMRMSNMPGMRSRSWSSWKTSWNNGNGGNRRGQYVSRSSSMPAANECGYWSMQCNMIQTRFQQNEICRPTHIILPCCC